MLIRTETPEDAGAVRAVVSAAFPAGGGEPELVDALRTAGDLVPELCLVAIEDSVVLGSVHLSRASLPSGHEILTLAPLAVVPSHQRCGIGAQLTREALSRASSTDFPLVVLLGHPTYYPRFGFEPAGPRGVLAPWDVPAEAWMMLPLPAYDPSARGVVRFPPAFDIVA